MYQIYWRKYVQAKQSEISVLKFPSSVSQKGFNGLCFDYETDLWKYQAIAFCATNKECTPCWTLSVGSLFALDNQFLLTAAARGSSLAVHQSGCHGSGVNVRSSLASVPSCSVSDGRLTTGCCGWHHGCQGDGWSRVYLNLQVCQLWHRHQRAYGHLAWFHRWQPPRHPIRTQGCGYWTTGHIYKMCNLMFCYCSLDLYGTGPIQNLLSTLDIGVPVLFSTRAAVAVKVLSTQPCVSSCLWGNIVFAHFFYIDSQCRNCWYPGDTRNTFMIVPEYSDFSTRNLNNLASPRPTIVIYMFVLKFFHNKYNSKSFWFKHHVIRIWLRRIVLSIQHSRTLRKNVHEL